jgi:hypothetical protein
VILAKGLSPAKINLEAVTMCDANVMPFQGVSHWWREFETDRMVSQIIHGRGSHRHRPPHSPGPAPNDYH